MKSIFRTILLGFLFLLPTAVFADGFRAHTFSAVAPDVGVNNIGTGIGFHKITWTTSGTVTTCQVQVDSSVDNSSWSAANVIGSTLCTSNGNVLVVSGVFNYIRINVTVLSGGGSVNVIWNGYINNPSGGFGGGAGLSFQDVKLITAPSNPPSGYIRLFGNSGTGNFSCLTSAGGNCAPSGGGSVNPTNGTMPINSAGSFVDSPLSLSGGVVISSDPLQVPSLTIPQGAAAQKLTLWEPSGSGAFYVALQAPSGLAGNITMTLPSQDCVGAWVSDGAGTMSCAASSGTGQVVRQMGPTIQLPIFYAYTVAGLPAAASYTGSVVVVNDASVAGSCTSGGGTSLALCRSSGAAWVGLGDGAGTSLHSITFVIDGGGAAIPTGDLNVFPTADFACTINRTDVSGYPSGSITVDIWKAAGAIPTSANKISNVAPVTLSSSQLNQNGSIAGWTTSVSSGDVFGATVATASTVQRATIQIWCQ